MLDDDTVDTLTTSRSFLVLTSAVGWVHGYEGHGPWRRLHQQLQKCAARYLAWLNTFLLTQRSRQQRSCWADALLLSHKLNSPVLSPSPRFHDCTAQPPRKELGWLCHRIAPRAWSMLAPVAWTQAEPRHNRRGEGTSAHSCAGDHFENLFYFLLT